MTAIVCLARPLRSTQQAQPCMRTGCWRYVGSLPWFLVTGLSGPKVIAHAGSICLPLWQIFYRPAHVRSERQKGIVGRPVDDEIVATG